MSNLTACINITENCDLNCAWCYQQNKRSKEHLALHDLAFLQEVFKILDIHSITLIGGEPTIHPQFDSILKCFQGYDITLVTNGLAFSNFVFLENSIKSGIRNIALSFKGVDRKSFQQCSQVDRFDEFVQALKNLQKSSVSVSFNFVCSEELMQPFMVGQAIQFFQKAGLPFVVLSDLRPYFKGDKVCRTYPAIPAFEAFCMKCLQNGIDIVVRPNNPLCWYSHTFIKEMLSQNRLHVQCAVRGGGRLHFAPNLDLILCNEFHHVLLGQKGKNYDSPQQFVAYLTSIQNNENLQKIFSAPSLECSSCSLWTICGGSCLIHWIDKGGIKKCLPWKI